MAPATVAELEMLEREIRHGSTAAEDVLAARIREGTAQQSGGSVLLRP